MINVKNIFCILAFLYLCIYNNIYSDTLDELGNEIQQIIDSDLSSEYVGIMISDIDTGKELFSYNKNKLFIPASVSKLYTTSAALFTLGPDYKYETSIYEKNNGIFIKFTGDPSLTRDNIENLLKVFYDKSKLKSINSIHIDNTAFDKPGYPSGIMLEDSYWYFGTSINTVSLDQNKIAVKFDSSGEVNTNVGISTNNPLIKINGQVKIVSREYAETHCSLLIDIHNDNSVELNGCWPKLEKISNLYFAIKNPDIYLEDIIKDYLISNNIKFENNFVYSEIPFDSEKLNYYTHYSEPLHKLINITNKESNNLFAEAITKSIGKKLYNYGSFQEGINGIKSILNKKLGVNLTQSHFVDGAGTRYNLLSPLTTNQLLIAMANSKYYRNYFIDSLPNANIDGTLEYRLNNINHLNEKVFILAKTGGMTGVSNLSGYITDNNKVPKIAFTVYINNSVNKISDINIHLDKLMTLITNKYAEKYII